MIAIKDLGENCDLNHEKQKVEYRIVMDIGYLDKKANRLLPEQFLEILSILHIF